MCYNICIETNKGDHMTKHFYVDTLEELVESMIHTGLRYEQIIEIFDRLDDGPEEGLVEAIINKTSENE